jgi:hypothetical protein
VKLYHPRDVAIVIHSQKAVAEVLAQLNCNLERMQVYMLLFMLMVFSPGAF